MDNQSIIIIILSLLCIIGVIVVNTKKTQSEHFTQQNQCSFQKNQDESDYACVVRCIREMGDNCSAEECLTRCNSGENACEVTQGGEVLYTTCQINAQTDIGAVNTSAGATIEQCVANCAANTCSGCRRFVIRDPQTGRRVEGNYTNNLNDFLTKCDSQIINHKYCSPCVEACYHCSDPNRCRWIADSDENETRKQLFESTPFTIGVIPDDRKAIIVWNELLSQDLISSYEIFIYRKAEINLDRNNQQSSPMVVRRETKTPSSNSEQSFEITGLSNGETYSINVNKVFNDSRLSAIKASNTVDIVPSKVNLINFSQINKETTNKQQNYLSNGILKDLTGKSFDITL